MRATTLFRVLDDCAPELEELSESIEETGRVPDRVWQVLVERGLSRMTLPEEWGGYGMPLQEYVKVLERAAGFHALVRTFVHGMNVLWRPLARFGTERQKRRWLPFIREGRWFALAMANRPTSGRDVSTYAVLDGDAWVLSGNAHIAFGADAEVHHVLCATGTAQDRCREWSCILVPRGTPGMTFGPAPQASGCDATPYVSVRFEGCHVPAENLLGRRGEGQEVWSRGFAEASRLGIAASCLGIAQRSFELTRDLAKERVTAGDPDVARREIEPHIGEMAAELYTLRSAIQDAAARFDDDLSVVAESAICQLLGAGVVGRVTDRALRIHRGVGHARAYRVERLYRDGRSMSLDETTAELDKRTISRAYLGAET